MAEKGEGGKLTSHQDASLDMDAMIDEILAKKGPQKYQDGLSEDNWEQVLSSHHLMFAFSSLSFQ